MKNVPRGIHKHQHHMQLDMSLYNHILMTPGATMLSEFALAAIHALTNITFKFAFMQIFVLIKLATGNGLVTLIAMDFSTSVDFHMIVIAFQGYVGFFTEWTFNFAESIPSNLNNWLLNCFWNTSILLFLLRRWIEIGSGHIGLLRMGCIKIKVLIN